MENIICPICKKSGTVKCAVCIDGDGYVWHKNGNDKLPCPTCNCSGKVICNGCDGRGTIAVPIIR